MKSSGQGSQPQARHSDQQIHVDSIADSNGIGLGHHMMQNTNTTNQIPYIIINNKPNSGEILKIIVIVFASVVFASVFCALLLLVCEFFLICFSAMVRLILVFKTLL